MTTLTRREFLRLIGASSIPLGLGLDPAAAWARMGRKRIISFTINQHHCQIDSERRGTLLDYLRDDLELSGAKYGCGKGLCGSCTVLIQHRPVRACIVDIQHLDGLEITTIEGLETPDRLDPIQQTFADLGVFQCGYCAPGIILTTKALLDHTPRPSQRQVKEALYGNLCRCTGYEPILEAVRAVNDPGLRERLKLSPYPGIADCNTDLRARDKVSGRLQFASDQQIPGQLFAQIVFSEEAHARILSIDTGPALKAAGVIKVLTHKDIPGRNRFGSIIPDQPVLAGEKVRCRGDVVALVIAQSKAEAVAGAKLVKIEYAPLPALFVMTEALKPGAPQMTPKGNVCWQASSRKGSIEKGRSQSVHIEKQTYYTQLVEHAYLETESCITFIDAEGYLVVRSGSQAPHSYRDQIAAICKIPAKRVRIQTTAAGGAFGAKGDLSIQHLCALGTLTTGKPVRLQLTREESIRLHVKRHPFRLEYETGIDEHGRLTFCVVRALADAGAYHSASLAVVENATAFATGPYDIDNIDVQTTAVFTNNPTCGAMRGFGVVQVCLAMERQIDGLAHRLQRDPLEIRLQNCLDKGKVSQWGQVMGPGVGIGKCLRRLQEATRDAKKGISLKPHEALGLGFAASYKNTSSPTNAPWGKADLYFTLNQHGRFLVYAGGCELGQGFINVITQFAALGLGVALEQVEVIGGSASHTTYPTLTSASQQTFIAGNAALIGGQRFAAEITKTAARLYGLKEEELVLRKRGIVHRADDRVVANFHEISWRSRLQGKPLSLSYAHEPPLKTIDLPKEVTEIGPNQAILPSLGYAAQAALVKVDRSNGKIEVLKIFAAHDVGRVANFQAARGQVIGGVLMSLGGCLKERLELKAGRIVNDNFDTYTIPRTLDVPEIEVLFVEEADPLGPLGVKGLGELPSLATAPAILNAIRDAIGIELRKIPIDATMILDPATPRNGEIAG